MGVHGLWRLIEPSGKPVPLETLENKVLAVDISIWLHQAIKGFQDSKGASLPNAHLLGIYHRVCKLLYFKIKPVFVFDGGVPILKKQTMAKRQQLKSRNQTEADRIQKQLISALLKHSAISNVLSEKTKAIIPSPEKSKNSDDTDLFALPSISMDSTLSSSDEEPLVNIDSSDDEEIPSSQLNIHNIDTESKEFQSLPADVRFDILSDVKETRKQSSWGRLHEMPTKSDDFSVYQMGRLLQRQNVQSEIEKTQREMGGHSLSLGELESLMKDQGIITKNDTVGKRIASDENTKFLLIKDVKQAIEEAQKALLKEEIIKEESNSITEVIDKEKLKSNLKKQLVKSDNINQQESGKSGETIADLEYEEDMKKAIQLSLECVSESSENCTKQIEDKPEDSCTPTIDYSFIDDESDSCEEEITHEMITKMTSAQSYMLEYSGLTPNEIAKILRQNCDKKKLEKHKKYVKQKTTAENLGKGSDSQTDVSNVEKVNDIEATYLKNEIKNNTGKKKEVSLNTENSIEIVVDKNCKSIEDDLFSDIFTDCTKEREKEVCKNDEQSGETIKENTERQKVQMKNDKNHEENDEIEIMSDSDSSVDNANKDGKKKTSPKKSDSLEIIINPNQAEEDDLFKDIFEDTSKENMSYKKKAMNKDVTENSNTTLISEVEFISDSDESDDLVDVPEMNVVQKETPIKTSHTDKPEKVSEQKSKTVEEVASRNEESTILESGTNIAEKINETKIIPKDSIDIEMELAKMHSEENEYVDETAAKNSAQKVNDTKVKETEEKSSRDAKLEDSPKPSTSGVNQVKLTIGELQEMKDDLRKEQSKLQSEKSLKERLAGNITDQMYQEAQELLELFGVPYITAPMEAEAQCAFLDEINLTDGTITDDSDIWLFGGKTVYKNFFNQSKHVMEFRAENIQHHFKLTREQMILLALLVGSDYTTGIQGVGPVTALEILAAFPPAPTTEFSLTHNQLLSGLAEFRNWFNKGKTPGLGRTALRSKLKNVKFSENFPNTQVVHAYLEPKVETSREKFSWAKPDIVGLIDFARQKFGWTITKSEEILNPVIKRLEEKHSQKTIRDYFKTETRIISNEPENKMSKRVKTAIKRIGNEPVDEDEPKPKQKRQRKKKKDMPETKIDDQTEENVSETNKIDQIAEDGNEDPRGGSKAKTKRATKSKDETEVLKPKSRGRKKKNTGDMADLILDEDVRILQAAASHSSKRVKEINCEIENEIKQIEVKKTKAPDLHKKEVIPQKERDKAELMRKKLKAIEVFRKSQKGPGHVAKRGSRTRAPKEDAGLSESSSDEN